MSLRPIYIKEAIITLTKDEEIDAYLRKRFWRSYECVSMSGDHRTIFAQIVREIQEANHIMLSEIGEDYATKWLQRVDELQRNAIIRWENYSIIDGITTLTSYGQYTYCDGLITERFVTYKNNKYVMTTMWRERYPRLNPGISILTSDIKIREYADYYEEEITMKHHEHGDYDYIKRTIYKRDLFREEYHTIPFQPVHQEMLYSLDVPKWYQNEARRAQGHFESLQ